jgi:uncharacterized protein with HEPN domain
LRDDRVYLEYITESIVLVQQYLAEPDGGLAQRHFYEPGLRQDAVLHRLETLAEAASHLSEGLKTRHPELPWRRISDFRNAIAHGYADLGLDEVWVTIIDDLPALRAAVDAELSGGPR